MSAPAANVTDTSGSYAFAPSMGESVLYAYGMCGVRRTAITQQHMADANMATNMMLGRWGSQGVNLWAVDLQSIPLVQGQATYPVPPNTVVMLDSYITMNSGYSAIDRLILPISRTEYASYPNKGKQGFPTTYWFDRLLSPNVTLWPVPDGTQSAFNYYRLRQNQDGVMAKGQSVEIPWYFWEAFNLGLAYRLALSWAVDRVPMLKPLADESYQIAVNQNVETAQQYITPMVGGYYKT